MANELDEQQLTALKELLPKRGTLDPDRRTLLEEMAKQQHIALPPILSRSSVIADAVKVAALPMAGQLAGGAVGAMSGNPALIVAGEIAGGEIGTKANEMFGISKPDSLDYTLTGAAPLVGAAFGQMARRLIPGAAGAEQQIGAEKMRQTPGLLEGSREATNMAYQQVGNRLLEVPSFSKTVNSLLQTEETMKKYGAQSAPIRRAMKTTEQTLASNPQGIPMSEVNGLLKRYREKVAGLETKGGEQYGAYKALRKSLFEDMETAIASGTGTDAALLRQAMGEAKKQIAKDEYTEILARYGTKMVSVGGQTIEVIEPVKVLNKLRGIGFDESVGKATFAKIETTLKDLAKIPKPSMETRSGLGSEGRALVMSGAGVAGAIAGGPMGGAGTALATYGTMKIHDAVANLFMSDPGRQFLVKLFKQNNGRIGARTAQVLQFAAAQFQDMGEGTPQRDAQINALTDLATNPAESEERRLQLGIPLSAGPRIQQSP